MGRENRKEAIASLHRKQILEAAEDLFLQKGYAQTTIDDISRAAEYSRRTIYSYYESKEDILHHIVEKGLEVLKADITLAIADNEEFVSAYRAICTAMLRYQREYPQSVDQVTNAKVTKLSTAEMSDTVKHILELGTEMNELLEEFIEEGKKRGVVRSEVNSQLTVYILWSSIHALLELNQSKGQYLCKQTKITEEQFLDYGFRQIINSILVERL